MKSSSDPPPCNSCRTRQLTNGIWECLSENRRQCPNALEFGISHHICRHPDPHKFRYDPKRKRSKPENGSGF